MTHVTIRRVSLGVARTLTRDTLGGIYTEFQANDSKEPVG